jgi:hypothetical protein
MADDIKIRIGLEGDAEIKRKLDQVRDSGKKSGEEISKAFQAQSISTGPALGRAIDVEQSFERNRVGAERLREAIHAAHPILDQAGIDIVGLGGYARLAGAGFVALAGTITGAVLVALAKMGEEIAKRKQDLSELARSKEVGENLFQGLRKNAEATGTTESGGGGYVENLLRLRQKQDAEGNLIRVTGHPVTSGPLNDDSIVAAERVLTQRGIIGGQSAAEAKKFAALFGQTLYQKGGLTPDVISQASPGLANFLSSTLGGFAETPEQLKIDMAKGRFRLGPDEINQKLAAQADQTQKAFEARPKYIGDYEEQGKTAAIRAGRVLDTPISQLLPQEPLEKFLTSPQPGQRPPGELIPNALEQPDLLGRKNPFDAPATNGPRSDAVDQATPAAIERLTSTVTSGDSATQSTLSSGFQALIAAISAALMQGANASAMAGPVAAGGIRGASGGLLSLAEGGRLDVGGGGAIGPPSDQSPRLMS